MAGSPLLARLCGATDRLPLDDRRVPGNAGPFIYADSKRLEDLEDAEWIYRRARAAGKPKRRDGEEELIAVLLPARLG